MSERSSHVVDEQDEPSSSWQRNTRSRSQLRPTRRSVRLRPVNNRSRSRSENGRRRSDSEESWRGRGSSSQRSLERQVSSGSSGPGSILAGVESHLLLLRRSLLLLSHLARPTTVQLLEDKPPAPPTSSAFIDNIPECRINHPGIECSICLAKFRRGTKASVLPCKHQFHNKCIRPWLKKKNSCPLCRHELPSDEPSAVRRLNPSFLDMYEDLNTFSEALEASRRGVVLTGRRHRPDLSSSSSSSSSSS